MINELKYDFDLIGPKITATDSVVIIENVKGIAFISDASVTVETGKYFLTVTGSDFSVSEIWEGRMELEGKIRGIELYPTLGKNKA